MSPGQRGKKSMTTPPTKNKAGVAHTQTRAEPHTHPPSLGKQDDDEEHRLLALAALLFGDSQALAFLPYYSAFPLLNRFRSSLGSLASLPCCTWNASSSILSSGRSGISSAAIPGHPSPLGLRSRVWMCLPC